MQAHREHSAAVVLTLECRLEAAISSNSAKYVRFVLSFLVVPSGCTLKASTLLPLGKVTTVFADTEYSQLSSSLPVHDTLTSFSTHSPQAASVGKTGHVQFPV